MVAPIEMPNKKKIKIYKGETPMEELGQALKDEIKGILEDAAKRLKCNPEELKYRVDNLGQIEVVRMTLLEMKEAEQEKERQKNKSLILRSRNG